MDFFEQKEAEICALDPKLGWAARLQELAGSLHFDYDLPGERGIRVYYDIFEDSYLLRQKSAGIELSLSRVNMLGDHRVKDDVKKAAKLIKEVFLESIQEESKRYHQEEEWI